MGFDITLRGRPSPHDADIAVRTLRAHWPGAVCEHAATGSVVVFPLTGNADVLVFRDEQARETVRAHGVTADTEWLFAQVIVGESVTIVVDRDGSPLCAAARDVLTSVRANRIGVVSIRDLPQPPGADPISC